jgi:integrase/recombinase XerD
LEAEKMKAEKILLRDISFEEAFKDFIEWKEDVDREESTLKVYEKVIHCFFRDVGISPFELTEEDVRWYVRNEKRRGIERNTIRTRLRTLSSFYSFMITREKYPIIYNPFKILCEQFKSIRKERPICATWDNSKKILLGLKDNPRNFALGVLLCKTGIRIGKEALNIEMGDIDFKEQFIFIKKRKGGSGGYVPFDDEVKFALERWILVRPGDSLSNHLFITQSGGKLGYPMANLVIKEAVKKAGVSTGSKQFEKKFTPHTFRTVLTTALRNVGCRDDVIRKIRGDAETSMLDYYTHLTREQIREEYLRCIPRLGI